MKAINRKNRSSGLLIGLICVLVLFFFVHAYVVADEADYATTKIVFLGPIVIDDVFVLEGETAVFTVSLLGGAADKEITIDYTTTDGTAISGADYNSVTGTVTFAPGQTTATISVPTIEDTIEEPDEIFYVDLSNVQGPAVIADDRGVGTIVDDDSNPASIIITDDTQYEGNPEEFFVRLSNPVSETVTVQYYTQDGTAIADEDYEPVPSSDPLTITFQPGEVEKLITVDTIEDLIDEPDETFQVVLENVSGPAVILDDEGVGTILDDDESGEAGGGGGDIEGCSPICPPIIPLVKAEKSDELVNDVNENGLVGSGDTIEYRVNFNKVEPSDLQDLVYVDALSQHVKYVDGSLQITSGTGRVTSASGTEVVRVDFSADLDEGENISFPLKVSYRVKLRSNLPETLQKISTQGTVYSSDSPTVSTDDPDTLRFDDPTSTVIGEDQKGPTSAPGYKGIVVEKEVLEVSNQSGVGGEAGLEGMGEGKNGGPYERFIGPGSMVKVAINVQNAQSSPLAGLKLVNYMDRHLRLQTGSMQLDGESVNPITLNEADLMTLDLPEIVPDEWVKITYWVRVEDQLHPDLGHIGTNAFVTGSNTPAQFSDDPDTEIFEDRTALLLNSYCNEGNYLAKWERWLKRIKNAKPSLTPVVLSPGAGIKSGGSSLRTAGSAGGADGDDEAVREDEVKSEELSWVMFGGDMDGSVYSRLLVAGEGGEVASEDEDIEQSDLYRYWPRYILHGAGELDIEPSTGKLFIGMSMDETSAGGAGGTGDSRGVYIQNSPNRPLYKRLSASVAQRFKLEGMKATNICGKEYLPYIMKLALSDEINRSAHNELFRVLKLD